jgi:hypothetical protein
MGISKTHDAVFTGGWISAKLAGNYLSSKIKSPAVRMDREP